MNSLRNMQRRPRVPEYLVDLRCKVYQSAHRSHTMHTQDVEYHDGTGKRYVGFLAAPVRPTGPAVLVAHNAPGVSDFERGVARRLAQAGYVALCADYIGEGEVLSIQAIGPRLGPLIADTTLVRAPIK